MRNKLKILEQALRVTNSNAANKIASINKEEYEGEYKEEYKEEYEEREELKSFLGIDLSKYSRIVLSNKKIEELYPQSQVPPTEYNSYQKPSGLWYGCGTEWLNFADTGLPGYLNNVNYIYEIEISDSVLKIDSNEDFDTFYWHFHQPYSRGSISNPINWPEVKGEYDGIEICPYLYKKRMDFDWYYPWDVASGCIWNPKGIKKISPIAEKK